MLCVRRARSALFGLSLVYLAFVACSGNAFTTGVNENGGRDGIGGASGGNVSTGGSSPGAGAAAGHAAGSSPSAAGAFADEPAGGGGAANPQAAGASGMAEGGAGGAEPTSAIPTDGLVLWFEADVGVKVAAGAINGWADQSGNHHDATQPVESLRPRLAKSDSTPLPVLQFDGVDDFLMLPEFKPPLDSGLSFFAVAARSHQSPCSALLEMSNGSEIDDISFDSINDSFQFEVIESTAYATEGVFPQGKLELIEVLQTSDPITPVAELRANGVSVGAGAVESPKDLLRIDNYIGKSLYADCPVFPGAIAEIILYGRQLDVDQRHAVERHLNEKWQCCN